MKLIDRFEKSDHQETFKDLADLAKRLYDGIERCKVLHSSIKKIDDDIRYGINFIEFFTGEEMDINEYISSIEYLEKVLLDKSDLTWEEVNEMIKNKK